VVAGIGKIVAVDVVLAAVAGVVEEEVDRRVATDVTSPVASFGIGWEVPYFLASQQRPRGESDQLFLQDVEEVGKGSDNRYLGQGHIHVIVV
jgi:hypothetical protein